MKMMNLAILAALALGTAVAANADTINYISSTPFLGALDATTSGTANSGTFVANYTASVYTDTSGGLDFVYNVKVTGGTDGIAHINTGNFSGYTTSLYAVNGGTPPFTATETFPGVIEWNYLIGIGPGSSTDELIVKTNATNWKAGTFSAQDGLTANFAGFEPAAAAATPEPASLALFGTGLLTIVGVARRRLAL